MNSIKENLKNLPRQPGVYLMYDSKNTVIYVGKAKILKNRVSQYFQKNSGHGAKVAAMIGNISRFEYIITESEFEALVLECNLIKSYMPKYNILLKDDKAHPYIKITVNEDYPRIFLTRKTENDGAKYFGPYLNSRVIYETIDIIKTIFNVRSCNEKIVTGKEKKRPCLNYQINKCSGPCAGLISQKQYHGLFKEIIDFLEGNYAPVLESMEREMYAASQNLEFEKAAKIRDKMSAVTKVRDRQRAVSTSLGTRDVIAFAAEGTTVCLQIFFVREGKISGREHYIFKNNDSDSNEQIMTDFIKQYYGMALNIPGEIFLQHDIEDRELIEKWLSEKNGEKVKISVPKRGDKVRIIKMAENNALETLKLHLLKYDTEKRKLNDLMIQIKELLGMDASPMRIEAYDISNISGKDSVGACVVFENGKSKKSAYKKFNIRSVETPDDYQSMREVLYRRLSNGINNEEGFVPLPDLILLDGGKGHVSAVLEIMDFLKLNIPVFGIVKDDKHKTKGLTTANSEIDVKRTGSVFRFLTEIQDEVHRFALGAHKAKRKKSTFESQLTGIKGVGEKKRALLLKHFKSIDAVKNASLEQLKSIKGIDAKTADEIYNSFN